MSAKKLLAALAVSFALTASVQAATFNVTKTDDTVGGACTQSDCSLREAVIAANAANGPDIINIPAGTYYLTITGMDDDAALTGDLDLKGELTLIGAGKGVTVVDGSSFDRVFHIQPFATVEISKLSVRSGLVDIMANAANDPDYGGGGILNEGSLLLLDADVKNSRVDNLGLGGGLTNRGEAYLGGVEFSDNVSSFAGAVYNYGSMAVLNSAFRANVANASIGNGGALMNAGTLYLARSLVTENIANSAGGISSGGDLKIEASEISGNQANHGGPGGIYSTGNLDMTNTTVAANTATSVGGGVYANGTAAIAASTIAFNQPDGLYAQGYVSLTGSIIAGNTNGNCVKFGNGVIDDFGWNLEGLIQGLPNSCDLGLDSLAGVDPLLQPLSDNGGPTRTLAPGIGSPAIDAGKPGGPEDAWPYVNVLADQRGYSRQVGSAPDIGAYETGGAALTPTVLGLSFVPPAVSPMRGSSFSYHLKVENTGTEPARDLRVLHYLPQSLTATDGTLTTPEAASGAYPPVYKIESLAPGQEIDIEVVAVSSLAGTCNLRAALTAAGLGASEEHFTSTSFEVIAPIADVSTSLQHSPQEVFVQEDVTYTVTVANSGPETAEGVLLTLSDSPSNAESIIAITPSQGSCNQGVTITCALGNIAKDQTVTIILTAKPLYATTITVNASTTTQSTDPVSTNDAASANLEAKLHQTDMTVGFESLTANPLTGVPYQTKVTVHNLGEFAATPSVAINPDAKTSITALSPSVGTYSLTGGVHTFEPGLLAPGGSATVTLTMTQGASGSTVHTATVSADLPDPDSGNNTGTLGINVGANITDQLQFAQIPTSFQEGAGVAVLSVMRTGQGNGAMTANYVTIAGTATENLDYTATSGTLTWADGELSAKNITIPLIDDTLAEGAETFSVRLTGIGTDLTATVTLLASDQQVPPPATGGGGGGGGGGGCFINSLDR